MPEYACKSKECEGRIFESKPNTARCIYCGSEDIRRIDRPWLRLLTLGAAAISIVFFLLWFNLALSDQQQEDFRNIRWSGCKNELACNYNAMALFENAKACSFRTTIRDCAGECLRDSDSDGVCDAEEILGCMDTNACNFDENATESGGCRYAEPGYTCAGDCWSDKDGDGVCDVDEVYGCTDRKACNFSRDATESAPTMCVYDNGIRDCDNNCYSDYDGDGICDSEEVYGCTDPKAENYNPKATESKRPSVCRYAVQKKDACRYIVHDGYRYDLVELNGDCWFAENLRSNKFRDGSPLNLANSNKANAQSMATDDGLVYNYYAVQSHRLCPSGWDTPSYRKWEGALGHSSQQAYNVLGLKPFATSNGSYEISRIEFWIPYTSERHAQRARTASIQRANYNSSYETRDKNDFFGVRCIRSEE